MCDWDALAVAQNALRRRGVMLAHADEALMNVLLQECNFDVNLKIGCGKCGTDRHQRAWRTLLSGF